MSLIYNISIIFILIFITILISITYFNNQNEQIVFRLTVRNGKLDKANDCTDLLMKNDLIVAEIRQQIKELFDLVGTSVNYDKNDKAIDSRNEFIRRQFGRLLGQVEGLSGQTYNTHKTELDRLAQHLKTVLYKLQYPVDCSKTRLLVCSMSFLCGFGCLAHHAGFCLDMAIASNRTLIFEDDGEKMVYKAKWVDVFLPITNCSYKEHVLPFLPLAEYKSTPQQERIVFLKQRADTIGLTHMPELAPTEYKEILLKHHTDPPAWFMGQLIGFVLRQNEVTHQKVKDIESKFNLTNGSETFAGIHVRRTDKAREAAFHELEEYIKWIDFWYTSTNQNNTLNKRRLFISTDEPDKIIAEAEKRWGSQYVLLHNSKKGFYGKDERDPQRHSINSLISLVIELHFLAKCKFVVCTLTSNVCRLVYELMQDYQGYAGGNVYSLDSRYAEIWYHEKMISIADYKGSNEDEIDAIKGDIIYINEHKSNGFVNAENTRTNKKGRFPISLLIKELKFESFPILALNETI